MARSAPALSADAARRVFLVLSLTRWFPVGLVVGIMTLWQLERGLTIAEAASAGAFQGLVVFLIELPTAGFADAFGRRPVYLTACLVQVLACISLVLADSFAGFALAAALFGVFRALESGPLEAWFVDTVHLADPQAEVDRTLAAQGTVTGAAIAGGAVLSGALVWWNPVSGHSALLLPVVIYAGLAVVHVVVTILLMHEPTAALPDAAGRGWVRARASAVAVPGVIRSGLALVWSSRVLRGLILAQVTWAGAMVVFETLQPVRLSELLGSKETAGAWMGPIAAGGWAVFGLGSAIAGWASGRIGAARTAIIGRVLNGAGAVGMGLTTGPAGLVTAYAFTYSMHGFAGPMHAALLHREARAHNRATVLSLNSMAMFAAFSLTAPLLGLLAVAEGTPTAMVLGGIVGLAGAALYLPAWRAERASRPNGHGVLRG